VSTSCGVPATSSTSLALPVGPEPDETLTATAAPTGAIDAGCVLCATTVPARALDATSVTEPRLKPRRASAARAWSTVRPDSDGMPATA
jgi:hypothetical protein